MARPKILESSTHLCLLLLATIIQAGTAISYSSYSSLCHFPVPSPDLHADNHSHSSSSTASNSNNLLLPRISTGHFSGGDDLLFVPERSYSYALRSFSFIPRRSALTTDPGVVRLVATLALEGSGVGSRRREHHHSVTFELEGYSSSSSGELCMVGSGSYARDDDDTDTDVLLSDVALCLHLPRPSNLSQPFVTGRLHGAGFGAITLVAYTDDDDDDDSHLDGGGESGYTYADTVSSCPPPATPARDGRHVLGTAGFSCSRLRALLQGSYELEHRPGRGRRAAASRGSSPQQLRLRQHRLMFVNQMSCATDGGVRAYLAFYANHSDSSPSDHRRRLSSAFLVGDEALVAEGFWDSSTSLLCLRACRVVRGSGSSSLAVGECGIGVSFWFPDTWSLQDRSTVVGLISNWSRTSDGDTVMMSGTTSASSSTGYTGDDDLSDIKYKYTMVEKAKEHYHSDPALSKHRNGSSFPGNNHSSRRDFVFRFGLKKQDSSGYLYGSPVTIGATVVVQGHRPMPDDLFSRRVAAEVSTQRLVNVSYDLEYTVADVKWHVDAEGVCDTKTGSLCMVACQCQVDNNGSSDCQVLVSVQLAPVDATDDTEAREHAVGTISSLRTKSDPLFFEALEFKRQGRRHLRRHRQLSSRMDKEITMLVFSPALSSVVLILQLRHAKKHPEAVPCMSVTMLGVLALGSLVPLMLDFEPALRALENRFAWLWSWYHDTPPNRFPLRVGTMLAFLLQLRLLQLAVPGRSGSSAAAAASERRTLQLCLPLYFLGAVLMLIANRGDGTAHVLVLTEDTVPEPTLADVLVSCGGLILDGFLLPQVISNALSGAKARALSPWFYVGGTVIRAVPHAYDVCAGPRGNLVGGGALDVAVLLGMASLAVLLFLQQRARLRGAFLRSSAKRRSGAYSMVSNASSYKYRLNTCVYN